MFRGWLIFALLGLLQAFNVHAASRLDRIVADGQMKVCIWPDYYAISYRDPRSGVLGGVDVELARALASDLKVGVQFVDSSFATLIADVLGERCDIAMFGIGITPARAEKLRFTSPHLQSDIYAITTRANRRVRDWRDIDRAGVVVAVTRGTYHERVMRERLRSAELMVVESGLAREQEVEAGRADVFMTDFPYSRRMLDHADWSRLISPPAQYHLTPYAWAMKPGDDVWHARVEAFIRDVRRDGRLLEFGRKYGLEPILVLND
jgi:cyclohexadienyl dehydratase